MLATVGAGALMAAFSSGASAFEVVDWDWTNHVGVNNTINVTSTATLNFDSLVELEKWQLHFGNLTSVANTGVVVNNPGSPQLAANLPELKNHATSVGNSQSIDSTTAVQLHDLQITAGGITGSTSPNALAFLLGVYGLTLLDDQLENINEAYDMAALTLIAAASGLVDPVNISATANVASATNVSVDNAATAVGNNIDVNLHSGNTSNRYLIGDITQLTIGNVAASATVQAVSITGYSDFNAANFGNLAGVQTPVVANVATAVGNNVNIKVGP